MQARARSTTGSASRGADYAVVGLGASGRATARFLAGRGARLLAMDTRDAPPCADDVRRECPDAEVMTGGLDAARLARCGAVVLSPGLPAQHPALAPARAAGVEIIGDIELFARHAKAPTVAITGTNGKSTVTTLVGLMLAASGREVRVGGNLGPPALDLIGSDEPDCYVLELSSFQLELTTSLAAAVAVILNLTPDHLDRYASFADYVAAKARILRHARHAVLNADDPHTATLALAGTGAWFTLGAAVGGRYGVRVGADGSWLRGPRGDYLRADALGVAGRHNLANALAALAVCAALAADGAAAVAALRAFSGLEHRAETVATVRDVTFINDSKATNSGAAIAAIEGLCEARSGVLIAGGEAKEPDLAAFADSVVRHMHAVVLIGRDGARIAQAIGGRIPTSFADDMTAAVRAAAAAARPGDLVLLAPACASFDMFSDYTARGRAFRAAVRALEQA